MSRTTSVLVRGTLLLLTIGAVGGVAVAAGHPAVLRAATRAPDLLEAPAQAPQALAAITLLVAATAATLAWAWLLAAVVTCVADELRVGSNAGARRAPSALRPRLVRLMLGGVIGSAVALSVSPAHASDQQLDPILVAGLLLPDRPLGTVAPTRPVSQPTAQPTTQPTTQQPPRLGTVTVVAGDTLWGLAAELLPAGADAEAVDIAWRALHAANEDEVGADPDLIVPGTVLTVPSSLASGAGR